METAEVNGLELEYEVVGSGEPVLLISMILPDAFLPLLYEPALTDRNQLIRYRKRGWGGSTHTPPPVSIAEHAADAAGLLHVLGIDRAHVAGHSIGGLVALQLAFDRPEVVHSLVLLEPAIVSVPSAGAFFQKAGPSLDAYAAGDYERAVAIFVSAAAGLDWDACQAVLDERVPGVVTLATKDADTFFGSEVPALSDWAFGAEQAASISQPVLSVEGTETEALFAEAAGLLRSWIPQVEVCSIDGVGHLLQMQDPEPVARGIAQFLGRNSMTGGG